MTGNNRPEPAKPTLRKLTASGYQLLGAAAIFAAASGAAASPVGAVPGQILLKPKAGINANALQAILTDHGAQQEDSIPQIDVRILRVPEHVRGRVIRALAHNPNIEFAEPNYLVAPDAIPNDPYFRDQWHLTKIAAPEAWDYSVGSSAVTIAILDSGINGLHPDLGGLMVPGWNFYDNTADTADFHGHGTVVAGTAAALSNNGLGIAGVTWGCRIMPLRICDLNGTADMAAVAKALTWAADRGARVANISYTSVSKFSTVTAAAQYFESKGGVVTASAGNSGVFDSTADNPHFLLVSATDRNDVLCAWSNTGDNVDLSAPGAGIIATSKSGGYASGTGTSMSAPMVAGVAALVISANPSLTGAQVREILKQSADDLGTAGWDPQYGWGRVNAAKALAAATGGTADRTAPVVAITAPSAGATLTGAVSVSLSASDNVGVTKVEYFLNGVLAGSSASSSALFTWDTRTAANSSHALQAKAYDAAGNAGVSPVVQVTVSNPVPDTTPPSVSVLSPSASSTLSGAVSVQVSGTDNVGVTRVEWYLNGLFQGAKSGSGGSFTWDTTSTANGQQSLYAKAFDAAGNSGASASVTVMVSNPIVDATAPAVTLSNPANGAVLSRIATVAATATDNVGVARIEIYIDGSLAGSFTGASASLAWDTKAAANGAHTIQAKAYDAAGNIGASPIATVTVNNPVADITPPVVQITSPASGATLGKNPKITVAGSDNIGIVRIELHVDGKFYQSSTASSATFTWNTAKTAAGSHTLQAFAYDAAGNKGGSPVVSVQLK